MPQRTKYVIITPCRNEAEYLLKTVASVVSQTVIPAKWIIVDDGSTDATPALLARITKEHPFIETIRRERREDRRVGAGVVDAFNAGLSSIRLDDYDYVCKLDADLEFQPVYFERIMQRFEADPWLGTLSGKAYVRDEASEREEPIGDENSLGAAKFYRVECFRDIGGFVSQLFWDAIDGYMCRLRGWKARSIHDEELKIIHLRRMGSSHINFWSGRLRWGRGKYFIGSAWYYVLASSIGRMLERPYLLSGFGIFAGYLQAGIHGIAKYEDVVCRRAVRNFEFESMFHGKNRTLEKYHQQIERDYPERGTGDSARVKDVKSDVPLTRR